MGCCCSKQEAEEKEKEREREKTSKKPRWDPPPPPPEEETVKEVLSETPKPKPKLKSPPSTSPPVVKPEHNESTKAELEKNGTFKPSEIPPSDDRSEQPQPSDDACSLSEVTSNATSVTTKEREREEISTATSSLPRIQRGNANGNNRRSYSGELVGGSTRRERSSPAVVAGVGCRSGRSSPVPPPPLRHNRSVNGNGNGIKRDFGERSGRRSLSPGGKRREVVGLGGHGEKLGVNRGVPVRRVPPMPPSKGAQLSESGGGPDQEGKETLENPSVSLECFIFL